MLEGGVVEGGVSAIVIRGLPDGVHAALKAAAASRRQSMEAYVRGVLSEHVAAPGPGGFAEAQAAYLAGREVASSAPAELFGAMMGSVMVAPGTDLAAPPGEAWDAES